MNALETDPNKFETWVIRIEIHKTLRGQNKAFRDVATRYFSTTIVNDAYLQNLIGKRREFALFGDGVNGQVLPIGTGFFDEDFLEVSILLGLMQFMFGMAVVRYLMKYGKDYVQNLPYFRWVPLIPSF